jgi:flagellar basal-body rod protein FlgC
LGAFDGLHIAASGLTAQRFRMDLIASNLANVNTTRTDKGEPFRRQLAVFASRKGQVPGVQVMGVHQDPAPFQKHYDPTNPDADAGGYVQYPNINPVLEMTDLISASRSYEAGITMINAMKTMHMRALDI